jgi:NitT/TauT family transport system permease protein
MAIRSPSGSTALDTVAAPAEPEWVTRPTADARAREARVKSWEPKIIGLAAVIVFFAAWQGVGWVRATSPEGVQLGPITFVPPPPLFLPTPLEIVAAFQVYIQDGKIWKDVAVSGQELLVGYLSAALLGIVIGLLIGWYARLRYALDPFITFLYATPRIVLLPLFIIWFGIGVESKIAVVFLGAIFAVIINTAAGVRNLDVNLIKVARSFGASDYALFRTIALPGSVPFILTGLRLGIGHALTGVVVGELVAAQFGVGQMMAVAGATFQSAKVFMGLFLIAGAGMLMTFALAWLESRFEAWRPRPN